MFRYRLEPLLKFRKLKEDRQRRALAEAGRRLAQVQQINERTGARRDHAILERARVYDTTKSPVDLDLYDRFIAGLESDLRQGTRLAAQEQLATGAERARLTALVKARRTLELHRDGLREEYDAEEARRERIEADEMAIKQLRLKRHGHDVA